MESSTSTGNEQKMTENEQKLNQLVSYLMEARSDSPNIATHINTFF